MQLSSRNLLVPLIEMVTVPKSFGKKKPEQRRLQNNEQNY